MAGRMAWLPAMAGSQELKLMSIEIWETIRNEMNTNSKFNWCLLHEISKLTWDFYIISMKQNFILINQRSDRKN